MQRALVPLGLLALGAEIVSPSPAHGFVEPLRSAEGVTRIHAVRWAVAAGPARAEDVWSVSLLVSGRGPVGFAVLGQASTALPANALKELSWATAPRFIEHEPWNPCHFGLEHYARVTPPQAHRSWPRGPESWTATWPRDDRETLGGSSRPEQFSDRAKLEAWLTRHGLTIPSHRAERLIGHPLGVVMTSSLSATPRWTPIAQVHRPPVQRGSVDLSALTGLHPPGRRTRVDIFGLWPGAALAPSGPDIVDMPSGMGLPEVAFEHPADTEQAAIRQRSVLKGDQVLVRMFSSASHGLPREVQVALGAAFRTPPVVTRYILQLGKKTPRPITLEPVALGAPFDARWHIHRPWRDPLTCSERGVYFAAVAKQQQTAHRVYAALTGRKLGLVLDLSRERGYLLQPSEPPLRPVEVDRSAWTVRE